MPYAPEKTDSWKHLQALAGQAGSWRIAELCTDPERHQACVFDLGGIYADLSKHLITDEVRAQLIRLAEEADVMGLAAQMFRGEAINSSEARPVLHTACRDSSLVDAKRQRQIARQQARMRRISEAVGSGEWTLSTGKAVTDLVNIGIGGSDLGPKMACAALRDFSSADIRCHFISNVDGAEINHLLQSLNPETTAFIISSKTFTTAETLMNANTALGWLGDALGLERPSACTHVFGITADRRAATSFGIPEAQVLLFDESIGGRYSVWSAIGLPVAINIGYPAFSDMLRGAAEVDRHFLTAPLDRNLPVQMALTGIWYNNFLGYRSRAVIPYCQRLRLFVDHLQQLDMESNGKSATRNNTRTLVNTGPVLWGQTGTDGQHSFFQLLHQGRVIVPVDFIGVVNDRTSPDSHHRLLLANMIAQSEALMTGRASDSHHHHYAGNRPSSVILLDRLDPATLGKLLALYEHKVFVEGSIWNVNSFDQWGVELGKALARNILEGKGDHDPGTRELLRRTGLDPDAAASRVSADARIEPGGNKE